VREFVANGFKVGPAYRKPAAPIAADWIEAGNPRLKNDAPNYADWWSAFEDPILNSLVHTAYARVLHHRFHRLSSQGSQPARDAGQPHRRVGPGFSWNILNYGRILNNVRFQYATQELVAVYQQKVLSAAREVENGIITYLNSRKEVESLQGSVTAARRAVDIGIARFESGAGDFTTVFVAQQFLVGQQNFLAQAEGDIALGLIGVYRAVGGGWEYRTSATIGPCSARQSRRTRPLENFLE